MSKEDEKEGNKKLHNFAERKIHLLAESKMIIKNETKKFGFKHGKKMWLCGETESSWTHHEKSKEESREKNKLEMK